MLSIRDITIDAEFEGLIPALSDDERAKFLNGDLGFRGASTNPLCFAKFCPIHCGRYWLVSVLDMYGEIYSSRGIIASHIGFMFREMTQVPIGSLKMQIEPNTEQLRRLILRLPEEPVGKACGRVFPEAAKDVRGGVSIYLIQSIHGVPVKIGRALNARKRLIEIQFGNPEKLAIIHQFDGFRNSVEADIHTLCAEYHLRGEWFDAASIPVVLRHFGDMEATL